MGVSVTSIDINTNKINDVSETIEDNINDVNVSITNETILVFVCLSIEKLEVIPEHYLVLEIYLNRDFREKFLFNYDILELDKKTCTVD